MNYSEWVAAIGVATGMGAEDENYVALIEQTIEYAEGRIYRDPLFDFLATRGTATGPTATNNRDLTLPATILIVDAANVIIPAGSAPGQSGSTRVPLLRMSLAYIDAVWGAQNTVGSPAVYAPLTDRLWRIGPVPDGIYTVEWVGTTRPDPLSNENPNTFITQNMPELFFAASMVFLAGAYMKNYGAQADDPGSAMSWEAQFNALKTGPAVEEARRKSLSAGGTPLTPTPLATPRS